MRKQFLALILPALIFAGCQPEGPATPEKILVDYTEFRVSNEAFAAGNSSLATLNWTDNDAVTVYFSTSSTEDSETYHVKTGSSSGPSATLISNISVYRESAEHVIAVHGTVARDFVDDGTTLKGYIELPSEKLYKKGSVSSTDMPRMAVARNNSTDLAFKNLLGVAAVSMTGYGTKVREVTLYGNLGELLSGQLIASYSNGIYTTSLKRTASSSTRVTLKFNREVELAADDEAIFFITLPEVEFTKGLTIEVTTAEGVITKTVDTPVSIRRNTVTVLGNVSTSTWADDFDNLCKTYGISVQNASDKTPMGTHFENHKAATADQKAWLADPSKQPRNLADGPDWVLKDKNVNLYPYGHPCPADVVQHNISNCCFMAVLASLSQSYPGFIENIITRNSDGSFTVKMYDPMGNQIDVGVTPSFFYTAKDAVAGCTGHNGVHTWSSVMEKALMKYENTFNCDPVAGINPSPALAPFVGDGTNRNFTMGKIPENDMAHAVETCLRNGFVMTGGFRIKDHLVGTAKTVTLHEYSCFLTPEPVSDYYPGSTNHYLFTLRNPWGFCNGGTVRGDGCMDIYWDEELFPKNIYLRILSPGAAAPYFVGSEQYAAYQKPF